MQQGECCSQLLVSQLQQALPGDLVLVENRSRRSRVQEILHLDTINLDNDACSVIFNAFELQLDIVPLYD
jgi:hypothetical protein